MTRRQGAAAFLEAHGWGGARRVALAGDASARSYARLWRGSETAILMDMPPESGLVLAPYLAVAAWLRAAGFSAPDVLAVDGARGLALIEDLGDDLFARLCETAPACEPDLYAAAIDCLADIQRTPPPRATRAWTPPPYDAATLGRESRLLVDWYLPNAIGAPCPADLAAEFDALVAAATVPLLAASPVAVLRDYHAENLIWLPDRRGHARVGLLDFQDLLIGHPAYDLASLLGDARRDLPPPLRRAMTARYLDRTGADPEPMRLALSTLGAQRNLKIVGLFTRLCQRDGKPRYLGHLPRVWRNLEHDLAHPALAALRDWIARHVPPPEPVLRARIAEAAA